MDYSTMTKEELRAACKTAGIPYSKLTNDAMRAALVALDTEVAGMTPSECLNADLADAAPAPAPQPDPAPTATGTKIEKDRETRNGVTRPSAGGKCRAIWDALDALANVLVEGKPTAARVRELAAEHGFDKTTAQVQFYRWRKFNGITAR